MLITMSANVHRMRVAGIILNDIMLRTVLRMPTSALVTTGSAMMVMVMVMMMVRMRVALITVFA